MKSRVLALVLLTLGSLGPPASIAATPTDDRIQKLEETIKALERRIAALESQLPARTKATAGAATPEGWRKLNVKMTPDAVRQLLGEPSTVQKIGSLSIWTYAIKGKSGQVNFGVDGLVSGWSEPQPSAP